LNEPVVGVGDAPAQPYVYFSPCLLSFHFSGSLRIPVISPRRRVKQEQS
jgi:hypothetical protein